MRESLSENKSRNVEVVRSLGVGSSGPDDSRKLDFIKVTCYILLLSRMRFIIIIQLVLP